MKYYDVRKWDPQNEISWTDVLFNFDGRDITEGKENRTNRTITLSHPNVPMALNNHAVTKQRVMWLKDFCDRHEDLFLEDMSPLYSTFYVPKRSGHGLRRIDAPHDNLKDAQRELCNMFQSWGVFHHTAAYAYVTSRSTRNAVDVHNNFKSEWFLKTDLSNFFGSTTKEFVMKQMTHVVPFCFIAMVNFISERGDLIVGERILSRAMDICFLNGGLPQGTPISPFLTNLIMIPIDHALAGKFSERKLVYSRYADDMAISGREQFPWRAMIDEIRATFEEFDAPYVIKEEKTKYVSVKGSNWMLGLCVNAEHKVTVGWKNKKTFKAMLNNFILDTINGNDWEKGEVQYLAGLLAYYLKQEPAYFRSMIERYNEKYGVKFGIMLKKALKTR